MKIKQLSSNKPQQKNDLLHRVQALETAYIKVNADMQKLADNLRNKEFISDRSLFVLFSELGYDVDALFKKYFNEDLSLKDEYKPKKKEGTK